MIIRPILDAGRIAEQAGCAAIALHGRTAQQAYSGQADWAAIAELKEHVAHPGARQRRHLGGRRRAAMVDQTGVDGVVIGRGCLGSAVAVPRPGRRVRRRADAGPCPRLGEVATMVRRHAELLAGLMGEQHGLRRPAQAHGLVLQGLPGRRRAAQPLAMISSLAELDELLAELDPDVAVPETELGQPRGRQGAPRGRVALPEGWLDDTSGSISSSPAPSSASRVAETRLSRPRPSAWAATMGGHRRRRTSSGPTATRRARVGAGPVGRPRTPRGARAGDAPARCDPRRGGGRPGAPEEPDVERTCFERDRDRIVHSTAFRRLAGKTQVVVYPTDHQRTRLTHALEVAQVATSIARGAGVNVTLADAIALGHDCGHGPGGHASEDAFDAFIPEGYDHGPWGADVVLTGPEPVPPRPPTASATTPGRGPRRARSRARSSAGPTGSPTAPTTSRTPCTPGSSARPTCRPRWSRSAARPGRSSLSTFVRAVVADDRRARRGRDAAGRGGGAGGSAGLQLRADLRPRRLAGPVPRGVDVLRALVEFYADRAGAGAPVPTRSLRRHRRGRPGRGDLRRRDDRPLRLRQATRHLGWAPERLPPGIDRETVTEVQSEE